VHAVRWADRIRVWAQRADRLVVAPAGVQRTVGLLDVPRQRIVALPNGVDTELFTPRAVDRAAVWRRVLVEQPRGWLPNQPAGSAGYTDEQVAHLREGPVLVYAGRFTAVKRLDRLIGAFARAGRQAGTPASLVLVGGHPGEWEGEHPAELARRTGARNVFLTGWYPQEALPELLSAADALVTASEREQFGQVLVEAMACGLPVVAPRALGPAMIVDDGDTGWLTLPDDEDALARALIEVIDNSAERLRRGGAARLAARERFSWASIADQFATVLEESIGYPRLERAADSPR
jgi:glycosyltransferase involved in cell wall biosynthesis